MAAMGSDDDYDELFRREHRAIVRSAYLIVGDVEVAREVAQEAFGRLYANWAKVGRYDRPGAWVRRVAIRLAVKADRRARRIDRRPVPDRAIPLDERPGSGSLDADLLGALATLPIQQRAALVLTAIDDLTTDEVAEALGCAPATVRVHLHRARARMTQLLTAFEEVHPDGE
jgi:RNA polymerase sigma-70 factor (ECF subfamily)